jgi:hypothetical protein
MMTRHFVVAGPVLLVLAGAPSGARGQAVFSTFVAGTQTCSTTGTVGTSSVPIIADIVCSGPGPSGGISDARAAALPGHVGARGSATKPIGGDGVPMGGTAAAEITDRVIFEPLSGTEPAPEIPAKLTLHLGGHMAIGAANSFAAFKACASISPGGLFCAQGSEFVTGSGPGGSSQSTFVALGPDLVQTPTMTVPVGVPLVIQFFLEAGAQAALDGSATSEFSNSLAFPTGMDVFELPAGYTANAPDSFLFDNRYFPEGLPAVAADAGDDQTVDEEVGVTLDGSGSAGQDLAFNWSQLAGPPVTLSDATAAQPSFTTPVLPGGLGSQTLTFELVVSAAGQSDSDTVDVVVRNVNHAPDADAGADQNVQEGSPVQLDGSFSFDPDGDAISHSWTQTDGPEVTLDLADPARPGFSAPLLDGGTGDGEALTFQLTVSDGDQSDSDEVVVAVEQFNHAPVANAGPDQTAAEGSEVALDGLASNDPDGDTLAHSWTQTAGPPVTLSSETSATPSFTAPEVDPGGEPLVFQLTVSDGAASSAPDEVVVTVLNANDPPRCDLAQPSKPILWPPNHKLVAITVAGVTDAEGEVTIAVDAVTQDEPVGGGGGGDTSPDAVLQGQGVLLRAERLGGGNGRAYHVSFTATDGQGGACSGSITVGVPHNPKAPVVDDGQAYDSMQP